MRKISELWSVGWSFSFFMVTNRSVVLCYSKVKGVALRDALLGYNNNYLRLENDADLSPVEGLFRPSTLIRHFHLEYATADIIIGYRADDSYFSFASDFINGSISYRQLSSAMRLGKLGQQFVLKSREAFERLQFLDYETAASSEWYKKRAFRDQSARRQYFDVERNFRQRGDLYITTILDEELKADDPRIR